MHHRQDFGKNLCPGAYLLGGPGQSTPPSPANNFSDFCFANCQNLFCTSPFLLSPSVQATNHGRFMNCHLTAYFSPWFSLWFWTEK